MKNFYPATIGDLSSISANAFGCNTDDMIEREFFLPKTSTKYIFYCMPNVKLRSFASLLNASMDVGNGIFGWVRIENDRYIQTTDHDLYIHRFD